MKYETPEMTPLTTAINAIQSSIQKGVNGSLDSSTNELSGAYADWE